MKIFARFARKFRLGWRRVTAKAETYGNHWASSFASRDRIPVDPPTSADGLRCARAASGRPTPRSVAFTSHGSTTLGPPFRPPLLVYHLPLDLGQPRWPTGRRRDPAIAAEGRGRRRGRGRCDLRRPRPGPRPRPRRRRPLGPRSSLRLGGASILERRLFLPPSATSLRLSRDFGDGSDVAFFTTCDRLATCLWRI